MRPGKWPANFPAVALGALILALLLPSGLAALETFPLLADFDGDHRLDTAELFSQGAHKSIHVTLGGSSLSHLYHFDSDTRGQAVLLAVDIDHDSDLDLIWVPLAQPQAAVVWLGDGRGNFEVAKGTDAYSSELHLLSGSELSTSVSDRRSETPAWILGPSPLWDLARASRPWTAIPSSSALLGFERRPGWALSSGCLRVRAPPSRR